jgi:hypothetical protein
LHPGSNVAPPQWQEIPISRKSQEGSDLPVSSRLAEYQQPGRTWPNEAVWLYGQSAPAQA